MPPRRGASRASQHLTADITNPIMVDIMADIGVERIWATVFHITTVITTPIIAGIGDIDRPTRLPHLNGFFNNHPSSG